MSNSRPQYLSGFVLSSISLAVFCLMDQASAQEAADPATQRVEVTGSSIKRIAAEEALPVTTIKAEEFVARGVTTLADIMMALPQSVSLAPSNAGSGTNINLRGLGVNRTLVLLNGRRLANEAIADGYANLDTIPISALDRVEVLRDGASSIYGSDAIGGVVNFITKRSYKGASITAQAVQPQRSGGADEQRLSFIVGKGDLDKDGWNIYATADAHRRSRLAASDRAELSSADLLTALGRPPALGSGGYAFPANVVSTTTKTTYNPYYSSGCLAPYSIQGAKNTCILDANNYNTALYGNQQVSFYTKGTLKLSDDHIITADYTRGEEYISSVRNPATSAVLTANPLSKAATITSSSKWYPGGSGGVPAIAALKGEPLTVQMSMAELGLTTTKDIQVNQRLAINDEGRIGNWDYKVGLVYGLSNRDVKLDQGVVDGVKLNEGISNGTINPFGLQDAAGTAFLKSIALSGQTLRSAQSTFTGVDATLTREIMQLPGGPLSLAMGGDLHRDTTRDDKKDIGLVASAVSAAPSYAASARNVAAAYAELDIPLTKELNLDLAVRDDHFSDFGNTVNPKASFRYQPMKTLMFRGSASTGFRAPTLFDRYGYRLPGANTTTAAKWDDPLLCPGGVVGKAGTGQPLPGQIASVVCNATLPRQTGSNPDLKPEKSRGMTLGVVLEPTKELTMSFDYWRITMTDMIANLPENAIFLDPVKYKDLFVRNPDNSLAYVKNITMNLGGQKAAGIDVNLAYVFPKSTAGDFRVSLDGTYLTQFDNQLEKDSPYVSNIGTFGLASNGTTSSFPIITFRWKHNLRMSWTRGEWSTQLTQSYNSGYHDQNLVAVQYYRDIDPYQTWNWTLAYNGLKNTNLVFGITNLLNARPPITNHNAYTGYLSSAASPIGRAFNARVTYNF